MYVLQDWPWHGSTSEQSDEQYHGMEIPKEHSEHHAMAFEDTSPAPIHHSLCLPKNLVQIL